MDLFILPPNLATTVKTRTTSQSFNSLLFGVQIRLLIDTAISSDKNQSLHRDDMQREEEKVVNRKHVVVIFDHFSPDARDLSGFKGQPPKTNNISSSAELGDCMQ